MKETIGPFRQGLNAARANLIPGLILQVIAVAIILAYYFLEPARNTLEAVARLKQEWGFFFSIPSTALFGGIIPLFFLSMQKVKGKEKPFDHLLFYTLFWAIKGAEIDCLYRGQAAVFGQNNDLTTLLGKVSVDQFLYATLWAVPSTALGYLWKDSGYRWDVWKAQLGKNWYRNRVLPLLLANWCVWIPAVALIYCLKLPLQLPMQNLILCMWSLMIVILTRPVEK